MSQPNITNLIQTLQKHPNYQIFDFKAFEQEIQKDIALSKMFEAVFDNIEITVSNYLINDTDIDERISNAVQAQVKFYQTEGLCFASQTVYNGVVLPMTYQELIELINKPIPNQSDD